LLQAGLKADIKKCFTGDTFGNEIRNGEAVPDDNVTVFELFISDKSAKTENRKRTLHHAAPVIFLSARELLLAPYNIGVILFNIAATK